MDFKDLVEKGVITRPTRDWFEPLWEQEQDEALELKEEEASRFNLFGDENDKDDEDDDQFSNQLLGEDGSISLNGVSVSYLRDDQSVGHGNRVWHASIATCLYLTTLVERGTQEKPLQSLELGAGTAIPSLYFAQILAKAAATATATATTATTTVSGNNSAMRRPLLHITDGRQYRNIRQILLSISRQSSHVRQQVNFRVSRHNWGEGVVGAAGGEDSRLFFSEECPENVPNQYDLVIVSDCIYNPNYHAALLESIAATLKFPKVQLVGADHDYYNGGRAVVSFSLHGNTNDKTVWNFIDMAGEKVSADGKWKLRAVPIVDLDKDTGAGMECVGGGGWNMEEKMKELDLWVSNLDPKRWIAYLYEFTWTPAS